LDKSKKLRARKKQEIASKKKARNCKQEKSKKLQARKKQEIASKKKAGCPRSRF
jgi:hypothetical protein